MNAMERYLAEEIGVDCGDGLIDRREALRRLGLLGIAGPAATALLAACSSSGSGSGSGSNTTQPTPATSTPAGSAGASGPAGPPALPTTAVTFAGAQGRTLRGAWAAAATSKGSVLVIHENRGLNDHIRSVAGRFAASGYSALAIDLLSEEGGTDTFTDPAQATAALGKVAPQRFVADLKAGIDELLRREPHSKPATVGFCFGGGLVWSLLAAGEPRLSAAVPFYGPLPDNADFAGSRGAAVLAIYAEQDTRVTATRDAAAAALDKAGLTHRVVTFPNANHAFFNDTGPRYAPVAAAAAYQEVTAWFDVHLG